MYSNDNGTEFTSEYFSTLNPTGSDTTLAFSQTLDGIAMSNSLFVQFQDYW